MHLKSERDESMALRAHMRAQQEKEGKYLLKKWDIELQ